jgi:hypothetical protein
MARCTGPPDGFNWNGNDEPVELNKDLSTYNAESRVNDFVEKAQWQANHTRGENVLFTMGSDFNYGSDGINWFLNMDKIVSE